MLSSCSSPNKAVSKQNLTSDLIKQAVDQRKRGQYETAIQIFTECIKINRGRVSSICTADTYRLAKKI